MYHGTDNVTFNWKIYDLPLWFQVACVREVNIDIGTDMPVECYVIEGYVGPANAAFTLTLAPLFIHGKPLKR